MLTYRYKACASDGSSCRGVITARDVADLERRLGAAGLDLICYRRASPGALRLTRREQITLYETLRQSLCAGIGLPQGLASLHQHCRAPRLRHLAGGLRLTVHEGRALSVAMAEYPRVFDPLSRRLIAIGEYSGCLDQVLGSMLETLRRRQRLLTRCRGALMYPLLAALVIGISIVFLLIFLVPQLQPFLTGLGRTLPTSTRALLATADLMVNAGPVLLAVLPGLAALLLVAWRGSPVWRRRLDCWLLRVPVFGSLLSRITACRLVENLALLYEAGVPILESLAMLKDTIANASLRAALARAGDDIAGGAGISDGLAGTTLFTPLELSMLRAGEGAGTLGNSLLLIAAALREDIDQTLLRIQQGIEPLLTLVLGVLLGWVALAVFPPIYAALGAVGGG